MALTKGYKDLLAEANTRIETVTAERARTWFDSKDPDVVFVDIRDPRELERDGMIPGALHAPRGMLEFWVDPESPYHKPVFASGKRFVLYCASGWRSALATDTLRGMGLAPICHLGGGFKGWKEAGYPVDQPPRKEKQNA
ncbi:rhodanese-like domain-containing protein [Azospirillum sp.]|uniref:rhodanese-like domain-containing protein n=1 Tax=Azospirillum sp. TaxID=34012 RepID=UPI003D745BFC